MSVLGLFGHAVGLLAVPHPLRAEYGLAVVTPTTALSVTHGVGLAALGVLAFVAVRFRRERPIAAAAAAWFVVPAALACNALMVLPVCFAERFLYLPSAAGLLLLVLALHRALGHRPGALMVAALPVVLGFGALTWRRNPDWRSTEALTLATVRDEPRSARFQFNLAVMLMRERRLDDALDRCAQVSRLAPLWSIGWGCQAVLLEHAGRLVEAEAAFRAMRARPDVASCQYWVPYARFLARTGRPREALAELDAMRGTVAWDDRGRALRRRLTAR